MTEYPWYLITKDKQILQGDFFNSVPYIKPIKNITEIDADQEIELYDVIVMSQSCDLIQEKLKTVLVCPIWTIEEFSQGNEGFKNRKMREKLRKGEVIGYHLLNKCELKGLETDLLIVDYRSVYSIPLIYLFDIVASEEKRLRLLPPYREHLSQSFARFFMRVGLPIDIKPFK